jgi:hypothetical protein
MTRCHGTSECWGSAWSAYPTNRALPGNPASVATCPYVETCPLGIHCTTRQILWYVSRIFLESQQSGVSKSRTTFVLAVYEWRTPTSTAAGLRKRQAVAGSANFASSFTDALSTSACRLLPCASIVTMTGNSFTLTCHIASGIPNSRKSTPSTEVMHSE